MSRELLDALGAALGESVTLGTPVSRGISTVRMATAGSGHRIAVKTNNAAPPGMFAAEARGLEWLWIDGGPRIPRVFAVRDEPPGFIAMEFIEPGPTAAMSDELIGRRLAALHRRGPALFGLDHDNLLATIPQSNVQLATWHDFLAQRRLLPFATIALDAGVLPLRLMRAIGHLADRCAELVGPPEPPARLHGDLWSGNLLIDADGEPVLIDPAVYGGHREMDLAMMRLFGGFSDRVFAAYDEAYPLSHGHLERVALNQVVPLLAHVILFGGSYVAQLEDAVGRYVPVR